MKRIKKRNSDERLEIRKTWDTWFKGIAPRMLCGEEYQHSTKELPNEYVERMKRIGQAQIVQFPLHTLIRKKKIIKNIKWEISNNVEDAFDPIFKWPENLVAAMNSVKSSFNQNPHLPRLHALNDQRLILTKEMFLDKISPYFEFLKVQSVADIATILQRNVYRNGEVHATAATKSTMRKSIRQWCIHFYTIVFRPVAERYEQLANKNMNTTPGNK